MIVRNLCPHPVKINGDVYPPDPAPPARVFCEEKLVSIIPGTTLPVYEFTQLPVRNLPDAVAGTVLIVSKYVALAVPDRADVYYPVIQKKDCDSGVTESARGLVCAYHKEK